MQLLGGILYLVPVFVPGPQTALYQRIHPNESPQRKPTADNGSPQKKVDHASETVRPKRIKKRMKLDKD